MGSLAREADVARQKRKSAGVKREDAHYQNPDGRITTAHSKRSLQAMAVVREASGDRDW